MRTKEFMKAWEELSLIQKQAAEWDEGPLLVLARQARVRQKFSLVVLLACLNRVTTIISAFWG